MPTLGGRLPTCSHAPGLRGWDRLVWGLQDVTRCLLSSAYKKLVKIPIKYLVHVEHYSTTMNCKEGIDDGPTWIPPTVLHTEVKSGQVAHSVQLLSLFCGHRDFQTHYHHWPNPTSFPSGTVIRDPGKPQMVILDRCYQLSLRHSHSLWLQEDLIIFNKHLANIFTIWDQD